MYTYLRIHHSQVLTGESPYLPCAQTTITSLPAITASLLSVDWAAVRCLTPEGGMTHESRLNQNFNHYSISDPYFEGRPRTLFIGFSAGIVAINMSRILDPECSPSSSLLLILGDCFALHTDRPGTGHTMLELPKMERLK